MTHPRPDRLNDNADHRADARSAGDYDNTTTHHAALGGFDDEPEAWEVADLEADGW